MLVHPRRKVIDWDLLLKDCYKLSTFINKIEKYSEIISKSEKVSFFDKYGRDGSLCFKGDVTEVFAEYFIKTFGTTFGIYDYKPFFTEENTEQDVGVDGFGQTKDKRIITVQVKYGTWGKNLSYVPRKLRTFHWTSISKYGVGTKSNDQMFIFTLAEDIDWRTLNNHFHNRLRFISQAKSGGVSEFNSNNSTQLFSIKTLLKGNVLFWENFYNSVKNKA